jgi:hypothetical protein
VIDVRKSSKSDGSEEIDGKPSVLGVVPWEETFHRRLQRSEAK